MHTLFPAHAGVIPYINPSGETKAPLPRARGGDSTLLKALDAGKGLFPAHAGVIPPSESP